MANLDTKLVDVGIGASLEEDEQCLPGMNVVQSLSSFYRFEASW